MNLGEDQPSEPAGLDEALQPEPELFAAEPPADSPAPPRRTVQLPETTDRLSFHASATTTSSDGMSTVRVNRFGEILDVQHLGPDPRTDSWALRFGEIGKIMAQSRWTWSVALAAMGGMSVAEHFGVPRLPSSLMAGRQPRAAALKHDFPGGVELSIGAPRPPLAEADFQQLPSTDHPPKPEKDDLEAEEGESKPFPPLLFDVDCPDPGYPELLSKARSWFFSGSQDERVKVIVDAAGRAVSWFTRGEIAHVYTKAQLRDVVFHCLLLARREAQAWLARHFAPLWQNYPTWLSVNTPPEHDWGMGAGQVPEALIGSGWTAGSRHTFDALPEFLAQPAGRWQPRDAKIFGWTGDAFRDFAVKHTETRTALDDRLTITVDSRGRVVTWASDPDLLRWHTLGELEWMLTSMYLCACKDLQLRLSALARQTNPEGGIRTLSLGLVDFSVHAPEFAQLRWSSIGPMRKDYRVLPAQDDRLAEQFGLRVRVPGVFEEHGSDEKSRAAYVEASQVAITCVDSPDGSLAVSVGADCKPLEVRVDESWRGQHAEEDVPWLLDNLYQRAVDLVIEEQIRVLRPVWRTPERLAVDRDVPRLWFLTDLPVPFHHAPVSLLDD